MANTGPIERVYFSNSYKGSLGASCSPNAGIKEWIGQYLYLQGYQSVMGKKNKHGIILPGHKCYCKGKSKIL